jgi:hypothetical protein
MTDRLHYLTVTLKTDFREDDAEEIIRAIKMIKGVIDVKGGVTNVDMYVTRRRVQMELEEKLWKALKEE